MAVIPLILGVTVVTAEDDFEALGARAGNALLIRSFDTSQLAGDSPNLSYDLRIGSEYKDHRDSGIEKIPEKGRITLLPGSAVTIETEGSLHVPGTMFGYIVPRVKWLQQGISNTLSKVDAGYHGHLLITIFNLGRNTIEFPRGERFCSLVVHSVSGGVQLYEGGEKRLLGPVALLQIGNWN
jgi:deoxycytidine triphosphate deaminase